MKNISEYQNHYSRPDYPRRQMKNGKDFNYELQEAQDDKQHQPKTNQDPNLNQYSYEALNTNRRENFHNDLDEYMEQYKKEKVARLLNEKEEKKEALQQLTDYNPWGRPGGGAPKEVGNQKMIFTEYQHIMDPANQKKIPGLQFGGEGGGDFLKTTSGHRRTEVPSDPDTRCGSLSYRHPHPMRYANSKENALDLKAALERGMEDRAFREEQDRRNKIEMEKMMIDQYDPFGKPGAGAPLSQRDLYPPKQTSLDVGSSVGYGAPIQNDQGYRVTKLKHTMDFKHGQKTVNPEEDDPKVAPTGFLQFRSPGGGHPNYDPEGRLIVGLHQPDYDRDDRIKKMKVAEQIAKDAEQELAALKLRKLDEEQKLRAPNDRSFQEIMDSFQFGKPKRDPQNGLLVRQHRVVTDVSQPRPSPRQNKELHDTLMHQMEVSRMDRKLEKVEDRHKAQLHYHNFPEKFDRANLDDVHYRNFDRILHNMPNGQPIVPQSRHLNATVRQYHTSYYQTHNPELASEYAPLPPFAMHEKAAQTYR